MVRVKTLLKTGTFWCFVCFMALMVSVVSQESEADRKKNAKNVWWNVKKRRNQCNRCHKYEAKVWESSAHSKGFFELNTNPATRKMVKALGGAKNPAKRADCISCHYTEKLSKKKFKSVLGVSCESCHGPAKKWFKAHQKAIPKSKKSAIKSGFGSPRNNFYAVAQRCYYCHTVGDEKAVNDGKHPTNIDFELVSWMQGEVRHLFLNEADAEGKNYDITPERKRFMYVVGMLTDFEYSLRGYAKVTQKDGVYAKTMGRRAVERYRKLKAMSSAVPEIAQVKVAVAGLRLQNSDAGTINQAADKVSAIAKKVADSYLRSVDEIYSTERDNPEAAYKFMYQDNPKLQRLQALDNLIPKTSKGEAQQYNK